MKQNERDNRLREAVTNSTNELKALPKDNKESYRKGFIEGANWQLNNQQSEVDLEELRKEFVEAWIRGCDNKKNMPLWDRVFDELAPYLRSKSEWIDASIEPALVDDEDYKEFIVIIDNEVRTGVVYCKKLKIFQGFMDTSKNPYKLNVSLYQPLPQPPTK